MKKSLLKSLSMTLVALATVVVVAMGVTKDVKAASTACEEGHSDLGEWGCTDTTHPMHFYVYELDTESRIPKAKYCLYFDGEFMYHDNYSISVWGDLFDGTEPEVGKWYFNNNDSSSSGICTGGGHHDDPPAPHIDVPKEVVVDLDTFKSDAPHGTAGISNSNSKVGDLKVHKVNAITETNQKFLADAFAKQYGKRTRILTTVSIHPRRELGIDNGKKESLMYSNLEKNPQTVYAVCYNQTDKTYYLAGTLDKNGVATFPDFILRDATNITIFTLE